MTLRLLSHRTTLHMGWGGFVQSLVNERNSLTRKLENKKKEKVKKKKKGKR